MDISINKSNYLKGIAIILMLIHHLFAYPIRISPDIPVYHIVNSVDLEMYLGLFGKICVSMFLFLSGYGFSLKKKSVVSLYLGKAEKFIYQLLDSVIYLCPYRHFLLSRRKV